MNKEKYLPSTLKNDENFSVKELAKTLCTCHHKCNDTKDCVVEDEALLLINENKSNNFDVKSNKQIEEMQLVMLNTFDHLYFNTNDVKANADKRYLAEATALYNAGYLKQSEGEWIVDAWDGEEWVIVPYIKTQHTDAFCSVCYGYALHNDKGEEIASAFCPHCGAKMKGEQL